MTTTELIKILQQLPGNCEAKVDKMKVGVADVEQVTYNTKLNECYIDGYIMDYENHPEWIEYKQEDQ